MKRIIFLIGFFLSLNSCAYAAELNTAGFDKAISSGKHLVEFYSPGCAICKKTKPIVEDFEKKHGEISKVNLVAETELANKYRPMNFPVFVVFQDGKEVGRFERPKSVEEIKEKFDNPPKPILRSAEKIKAEIYDHMVAIAKLESELRGEQ